VTDAAPLKGDVGTVVAMESVKTLTRIGAGDP
jgi:hypothetical protein